MTQTNNVVAFGERLCNAVKEQGLPIAAASFATIYNEANPGHYIDTATARRWLVGLEMPTVVQLKALAKLTKTTVTYLKKGNVKKVAIKEIVVNEGHKHELTDRV